jgi:hypothetical protein
VVEVWADPELRRRRLGGALPAEHASEVIDFYRDGTIVSESNTILSPEVLDYLGLPMGCVKCALLERHPFHDNGAVNPWE